MKFSSLCWGEWGRHIPLASMHWPGFQEDSLLSLPGGQRFIFSLKEKLQLDCLYFFYATPAHSRDSSVILGTVPDWGDHYYISSVLFWSFSVDGSVGILRQDPAVTAWCCSINMGHFWSLDKSRSLGGSLWERWIVPKNKMQGIWDKLEIIPTDKFRQVDSSVLLSVQVICSPQNLTCKGSELTPAKRVPMKDWRETWQRVAVL